MYRIFLVEDDETIAKLVRRVSKSDAYVDENTLSVNVNRLQWSCQ